MRWALLDRQGVDGGAHGAGDREGSGEESYLILSVMREEQVEEAIRMLRDVCGDFAEKGTGIVFTIPVTGFIGPV